MSLARAFVGVLILFLGLVAPLRAVGPDPLIELRALYLQAAEEEARIDEGLQTIAVLRSESSLDQRDVALLDAYEGALVTLRAKYVFWPATRMRHLSQGLTVLDRAVRARPDDSEIRYLRLMSCYYLPGFIGRGGTVREDFSELARTLPDDQSALPAELYRGIGEFVMANGDLPQERTRLLRGTLD